MKTFIRGLALLSLILLAAGVAGAANSRSNWEFLGQREVDFRSDRDQIDVDRSEGRFKQLQIRVRNAPIAIFDMVVTFGNDRTFRPNLRHNFTERSGTRVIDLPGDRRNIKRIDFHYKSSNRREGKGIVEVFAR